MNFKYKNTEKLNSKYEWIATTTAAQVKFDGKLSLGCPVLNEFLRGGLPLRGITEISGESASGKTQLCLQLSIAAQGTVQEGGLDGAVLFICTEDPFPIKRLNQLLNHSVSNHHKSAVTDRIFVEHVEDVESLQRCLEIKFPVLANKHNIKLLIIDSIAALFRCQFECSEAVRRANKLSSIGNSLHIINETYEIAIVSVNQVTGIMGNDEYPKLSSLKCAPSLGLCWSNIINTRIMLSRTSTLSNNQATTCDGNNFDNVIRKLEIIFSPYLPPSACCFIVSSTGVNGLEMK